jgi:NADPH:quinone reductase-like Zn-dependent oxidoreductase
MQAVSLNYRDLLVLDGVGSWKPTGPRVPLSDGAGVVVAVGAEVTRWREGDRVAGLFLPHWHEGELTAASYTDALGGATADGVLADCRLFDEGSVVAVPPHLTAVEASTLPVAALTAWHAVQHRCRVAPGDTVLVQGTGGVSLFALQFVVASGGRAIVLSSSAAKLERARQLGASDLIDYTAVPDWEHEVLARTGGRGVDHVIEVVGGANLNRSLRAVRIGGSIAFIGLMTGLAAQIHTYEFVTRNVTIHGIETGSRQMFEQMNAFLAERQLRPVVDRVFPLDELPQALEHLRARQQVGKVVVATQ